MKFYDKDCCRLYLGDCIKVMGGLKKESVDMIFADPPYNLSNDGITCKNGEMVSVNKGEWDKSKGFIEDYKYTRKWLKSCDRVLKHNGTIWITGTYHNIHIVTFVLLELGYCIINEIAWYKSNAAPNLSCRCFTASHETIIWAKKSKKVKHKFNYLCMKEMNNNKQMRSVWTIPTTPKSEKKEGYHPTQKPKEILYRCILASTDEGDLILDPFAGSGTTGVVSKENKRKFIGVENEKEYIELMKRRIETVEV
ncbi:site-specific DNA-methyltransferase [Clostridium baratii]|uniref:DNA-methyltransferase n=1 Tax=Clostridium baratii TaxID=1561 RepID=UPI0030D4AEFA